MALNLIDDAGIFNKADKSSTGLVDDAGIFDNKDANVQATKNTPFLPNVDATEKLISSRGSNIRSLVEDPSTLTRLKKHPIGTTLRTIGGAFDYLEGVPASIAIDLQQGKPENILKNLGKVATGERVPQRGDILRNIGINEFASSTVGLLSGAARLSPESALGKVIFNNPVVTKFADAVSKVGVDAVSKVISIAGDVPQDKVIKAINNPNFLSKGWINKNSKIAENKYKSIVQPLIDDNTKKVDTSSLKNVAEDLGLIQKNGDYTKAFQGMKAGEKKLILDIENKLYKNKSSFNDIDGLIGKLDSALESTYKAKDAGKTIDYSKDFVRTATVLRSKMNAIRKFQYPDAGKVLDEYSLLNTAKSVFRDFDRYLPHWLPAIQANAVAATLGGVHNPMLFGVATLGATPKLQSLGIQGAGNLIKQSTVTGGAIGKHLSSAGIKGQAVNRLLSDSEN